MKGSKDGMKSPKNSNDGGEASSDGTVFKSIRFSKDGVQVTQNGSVGFETEPSKDGMRTSNEGMPRDADVLKEPSNPMPEKPIQPPHPTAFGHE